MSYGIIRMDKCNRHGVTGLQIHMNREKDSLTNLDIDKTKSNQNYSLIECNNYHHDIDEKLKRVERKKAIRKDAVVMCGFVITSDSDFFKNITPKEEKDFFEKSLEFIKKRYGQENVISAKVHKD